MESRAVLRRETGLHTLFF